MSKSFQVIYFSRSGHSRRLARQLRDALDAKLTEIVMSRYRLPVIGWYRAGRDSLRKVAPPLQTPIEITGPETIVVLVGPLWAGQPAAPLNAAVDMLSGTGCDVAVAITCGDRREPADALDVIATRLGRPLAAQMVLSNAHEGTENEKSRIAGFLADLQGSKAQSA